MCEPEIHINEDSMEAWHLMRKEIGRREAQSKFLTLIQTNVSLAGSSEAYTYDDDANKKAEVVGKPSLAETYTKDSFMLTLESTGAIFKASVLSLSKSWMQSDCRTTTWKLADRKFHVF